MEVSVVLLSVSLGVFAHDFELGEFARDRTGELRQRVKRRDTIKNDESDEKRPVRCIDGESS